MGNLLTDPLCMDLDQAKEGELVITCYGRRYLTKTISKRTPKRIHVGVSVYKLDGFAVSKYDGSRIYPCTPEYMRKLQEWVNTQKAKKKEQEKYEKERSKARQKFIQDSVIEISSANSVEEKAELFEQSSWKLENQDY